MEEAWTGRFSCREEVDEYLGGETIHCLICWRTGFERLVGHLGSAHGLSARDYRSKFGIPGRRGLSGSRSRDAAKGNAPRVQGGKPRGFVDPAVDWPGCLARLTKGETIRVVCTGKGGMPTRKQFFGRRTHDQTFRASAAEATQGHAGARVSERRLEAAADRLKAGKSLTVVSAELNWKGIFSTLTRMRRRDPAIEARFASLIRPSGSWQRPAFGNRGLEEFNRHLRQDELYAAVDRAVPRWLQPHDRDDVKSDLIMAVLSGEIAIADIPRVTKVFVSAHTRAARMYDRSIDAPMGDGGMTLGGLIADPGAFDASGMNVRIYEPAHLL